MNVRRLYLPLGIAVLLAATAATACWITRSPTYTATAMLRVAAKQESLVFDVSSSDTKDDFDIYKNTQKQLLTSDFVLIAALRNPEVRNLALIHEDPDPIHYLAENIHVDFPGNSELMRVHFSGVHPKEAAALVNAVVGAYMNEVVDRETGERRRRLFELDELYITMSERLRHERNDLMTLSEEIGTADSPVITLKRQMAFQRCSELQKALLQASLNRLELGTELATLRESLDKLKERNEAQNDRVSDMDLDAVILADTVSQPQDPFNIGHPRNHTFENRTVMNQPPSVIAPDGSSENEEPDESKGTLPSELFNGQQNELESRIASLSNQLAVAVKYENVLKVDVEASQEAAELLVGSSIDVQFLQEDISRLEDIIEPIAEQREQLQVELNTSPRVQLIQEARTPATPDSDLSWLTFLIAGAFGFLLPIGVGIGTRPGDATAASSVLQAILVLTCLTGSAICFMGGYASGLPEASLYSAFGVVFLLLALGCVRKPTCVPDWYLPAGIIAIVLALASVFVSVRHDASIVHNFAWIFAGLLCAPLGIYWLSRYANRLEVASQVSDSSSQETAEHAQ